LQAVSDDVHPVTPTDAGYSEVLPQRVELDPLEHPDLIFGKRGKGRMKTWKKIALGIVGLLVLMGVAAFLRYQATKDTVVVQTGKSQRQDVAAIVSASGEIKPKTYVNIGANAFGKITHLYVREGDRVKKGQLLAQLENVQPEADVAATKASLEAAATDALAAEAGLNTAKADLNRAKADVEKMRLDWSRAEGLYKDALISKAEYESRKATWEASEAGLAQAEARVAQAKAQLDSSNRRTAQTRATLTHASDVLQKTTYEAPFDGMITNLPVREGETVVIGIQNSPGSTLMTIADMSVITAEVKVDETDIVNVQMGQPAEVSIDAIPRKTFHAAVTEIGNNAIVRSSGVSTSQQTSASQEAKDFKVVVTLQDPPADLRPGLSATAKVTTATRRNVLTIPIQALAIRSNAELVPVNASKDAVQAAAPQKDASKGKETQGVFVVRSGKVEFVPVETGIAGTTDIEVLNGLKEGDEIVTGSYKVLRTIRPGATVKVDNSVPKKEEST